MNGEKLKPKITIKWEGPEKANLILDNRWPVHPKWAVRLIIQDGTGKWNKLFYYTTREEARVAKKYLVKACKLTKIVLLDDFMTVTSVKSTK